MKNLERILVIRLGAMGDVLLTTPALRCLRQRFPHAQIDMLVKSEFAPLVEGNTAVNHVYCFTSGGSLKDMLIQIRAAGYTHVADLQSNIRSILVSHSCGASHRVRFHHDRVKRWMLIQHKANIYGTSPVPVAKRFLNAVAAWGVEDDSKGLYLNISADVLVKTAEIFKQWGIDTNSSIIAIAPGASRQTKQWHKDSFCNVARYWADKDVNIIVVGGPEEIELCRTVAEAAGPLGHSAAGIGSRMETAGILSKSSLLLSNDTGLMHMACALNIPVTAIFGPTTHQLGFFPYRARAHVIEEKLACRPCSKHGSDICPQGHFDCMNNIQPVRVIEIMKKIMV
ncbi:glycosyltransferase family 9 protein [bacterium]|nr:glycosyltransferase family 9 protein [bacterium]